MRDDRHDCHDGEEVAGATAVAGDGERGLRGARLHGELGAERPEPRHAHGVAG